MIKKQSTFYDLEIPMMKGKKPATIDAYIAMFPKRVQLMLQQMRLTIQTAAPFAVEAISYQMPTFKLNGKNLVHFAAFQHHIGFYPIPSGIAAFQEELSVYKQGKGSVQFPLDKPIPYDLVKKIVMYRVKETLESSKGGGKKYGRNKRSPDR